MSLQYKEGIPSVIIQQLQTELRQLQESAWPMSRIRRRALVKKLKELATGSGEPDINSDIERLVKVDVLQKDIKELDDLSLITSNAWVGLKTDLNVVRSLLSFQTALAQARLRSAWEDIGLDPVNQGLCG